jgi:hypothetical protein
MAPSAEVYSTLFAELFSAADLEVVRGWGTRWRIELLCLSGLWVKVPEADWESWLVEYEAAVNRRLGRPFPPGDFLGHDDPRARLAPLARALGIRRNTLATRWHRARGRWRDLVCLRDLYFP